MSWINKKFEVARQVEVAAGEAYGRVRFPHGYEILRLYPVGTEFQYLGMVLKVVRCHMETDFWSGVPKAWFYFICSYVDHQGRISDHKFSSDMHEELVRMAKEVGR